VQLGVVRAAVPKRHRADARTGHRPMSYGVSPAITTSAVAQVELVERERDDAHSH
jgi:hypothetical protein